MAINIKFDLLNNPEPPTIVLANRNGNKLGQLKVNTDTIDLKGKFNDANELSFTVNKYIDGEITPLWDKVVDFKLVYCKEWDAWFEITVELDEATETVKTVFGTQLGQAELSQIMLYNIEINTDADMERDDYKISILYDENDSNCILHRLLKDKAPHYSIAHVDDTIKNIQRSFSFDGTSIYDAFQEISEEIGCLFQFYAVIENGVLQRKIDVYDLQQSCNDCGYRGEFTDKCPKCDSTNIAYGYGDDTLIFVTADELGSQGIQLVTDTDSVKNCFKLEAGDDLMTATVRNCNPNGTDYIWYFSEAMKEDMSDELVEKLKSYDEKYKDYYKNYVSVLDTTLLNKYNALVSKYSVYNEDLQTITSPIVGYPSLMNAYYNTIDLALYLESSLMPSVEMSETSAEEQLRLLTSSSLSPVAVNVEKIANVSLATANSAVLSMARIIVKSTYKVEIKNSSLSNDKVWTGRFIVTNYSDEEDTAENGDNETVSVSINNDTETFIKQKIDKALNKENTDDLSISGLFDEENYSYNEFCDELKKYALNPLQSFYDACEACLSILIDQGAGSKDEESDDGGEESEDEIEKPDLYEKLYLPYFNKSIAIANEIKIRENEIAIIKGVYDESDEKNPILKTRGLQTSIEECRNAIQSELDFEKYLGEVLWLEFCTYRREDKYSNDNYISDGLNNAEVFERALEFIDVAENEIFKSAELQHSISTTLNNLLAIPKFRPLVHSFNTGNWIRVQINDEIYKLRLLEYGISFGDFNNISVEFSDVTKIKNGVTDVQSVFEQASSMATSYSSVQRQANQGTDAKGTISNWLSDGLNSANVRIQSNDSEDITLTRHGLLARSYDDITETYSPEQLRITHNIMAYTDDNWRTVKQAIGKHDYKAYDDESKAFVKKTGYGVTSDFLNAAYVGGSQMIGGDIYSDNYEPKTSGTHFNLRNGEFEIAGGKIVYDVDSNGESTLTLKNVTIEWANTNAPEITDITGLEDYLDQLEDLEDQVDKKAETWYQDTDPSDAWTTSELKALHVGDLWHYTGETATINGIERIKNSEWVWRQVNGDYQWVAIEISDEVFDAIDGKSAIYISKPSNYKKNDMWILDVENEDGSYSDYPAYKEGTLLVSSNDNVGYSVSDWSEKVRYTDDTLAQQAREEAKKAIDDAAEGISLAKAAQSAADAADKKAQDAETNAKDYADAQDVSLSSTLTNAYTEYTNSEVKKLDDAVSTYLGWDGKTIIDDKYVISPYLGGGYLNITGTTNNLRVLIDPNDLTKNGYVFQVLNGDLEKVVMGVDGNGNAEFNGAITATSLTLGDGISISTDYISGLDKYATTDDLPKSVTDLEGGTNIIYADDVLISETTSADGTTVQSITVGDKTYTSIIDGDFIFTNIGLGTDTEDGSQSYTCISTDGLLTAKNAIVYGTVYATAGRFSGDIIANSLTLGNDVKISTDDINGLSDVATSGDYDDLLNTPKIPTSVSELGLDTSTIIYKGDITQTSKTDDNGISYVETSVPTSDGTNITYETYDANDYIVFGRSKGTDSDGNDYICVSKEGLLTARNALIYGTVYATDGEFTGTVNATAGGHIGGWYIGGDYIQGEYVDGNITYTTYSLTLNSNPTINGNWIEAVCEGQDGTIETRFSVSGQGVLNATGADIAGTINATSGSFTNGTISDLTITGRLSFGNNSDYYIDPNYNNQSYYINLPNFYVDDNGAVFSGTLSAAKGDFEGEVTATSGTFTNGTFSNCTIDNTCTINGNLTANAIDVVYQSGYISRYIYTTEGRFMAYESNGSMIYTTDIWGSAITLRCLNGATAQMVVQNDSFVISVTDGTGNLSGTWTSDNDLSDERVKNTIEIMPESYDILFDNLQPKRYKYNHGTSNRFHTGYVAQEVVSAVETAGLTTQDFAGVMLINPDTEDERWYLRRDEFVALNTWQIQKLKKRVEELEAKLDALNK